MLLESRNPRGKRHGGMGVGLEPLDRHVGELVLLALHDVRIARVIFQQAKVELGDHLAGGAVPNAESRFDEATLRALLDQPQPLQHFQRRRVRGRGARQVVDLRLGLEQANFESLPGEGKRGDDANGTAASHHYGILRWHCGCRCYGALRPVNATASAQVAISTLIMAANSSGVLPSGLAPAPLSRPAKSGSSVARLISPAILSTMSRGVPAGATRPFHVTTLKPGKPDSATVGTSGICGSRCAVDTASRRIAPEATCGRASDTFENMVLRCPAMTSFMAGGFSPGVEVGLLWPPP